jgi:hypothetical protein
MSELSREQVADVVSRVIEEVGQEVKAQERAFGVSDLQAQVAKFAKAGGESLWTISYSTSLASVERLRGTAIPGGENLWTISYSTSAASVEKAPEVTKER